MPSILDRLLGWLGNLLLPAMAILLLLAPSPYLQDFAEWLYQGFILAMKLVEPERVSRFILAPYPVPNSLAPLALALLCLLFEPITAGRLFLALLLLGWWLVLRAFVRRHLPRDQSRSLFALLVAVAALASFFWYGFIGYQLGLLLWFAFLAWMRQERSALWLGLFGLAIFFAHAMVFLAWGLLMGLWALHSREARERVTAALLPSVALSLAYLIGQRLAGVEAQFVDARIENLTEAILFKLASPLVLGGFRNLILPDGTSLLEGQPWLYWTGAASNALTLVILATLTLVVFLGPPQTRGSSGSQKSPWPVPVLRYSGLVLILVYLLAPYNLGGLIHPGGRLLLPLLAITLMLASPRLLAWTRWAALAAILGASISLCSYGLLIQRIGTGPIEGEPRPSDHPPRHSVLAFNQWMFGHTAYKYFNYRIFTFADRFRQLREGRLEGLAFHTGPIIGYVADPAAKAR